MMATIGFTTTLESLIYVKYKRLCFEPLYTNMYLIGMLDGAMRSGSKFTGQHMYMKEGSDLSLGKN